MFFPPRCVFCGDVVYPAEEICAACRNEVHAAHLVRRIKVGQAGDTVCCLVPYWYEGRVRESILRFKFQGCRENAPYYARKIVQEVRTGKQNIALSLVTAVPLSAGRLRERGYNQSELIAQEAAKRLELPYTAALSKVRENKIQHELKREARIQNVRGAYRVCPEVPVKGKAILLVDDIVTTGATLGECARVLLEAGAAGVLCAAVADAQ